MFKKREQATFMSSCTICKQLETFCSIHKDPYQSQRKCRGCGKFLNRYYFYCGRCQPEVFKEVNNEPVYYIHR